MKLGLLAVFVFSGLWSGAAYAQTQPTASGVSQAPAPASSSEAPPAAPSLTLAVGASAWSGDYGAETTTDIDAVLLSARYKLGPARFTASVPWMRIDSDGAIFTGIEGTPLAVVPGASSRKTVRDGLGDLTLGASYLLTPDPALGMNIDLSFKVKVPTASGGSGLSTGQADYVFRGEVSKSFGRFSPFASAGYRVLGDTADFAFRNGAVASVGASYLVSDRWVAAFSYDYAARATQFIADSHELSGSVSTRLNDNGLRLTGFVAAGLSSGAAAVSGGMSVSLGL